MPKHILGALFESAVIERYRRREESVEEALKAVFAMESREEALTKAEQVAAEMDARKLKEAAKCLREGINETTTYLLDDYPVDHRRRIRTNNMIE